MAGDRGRRSWGGRVIRGGGAIVVGDRGRRSWKAACGGDVHVLLAVERTT
jgi:hypothetical protein